MLTVSVTAVWMLWLLMFMFLLNAPSMGFKVLRSKMVMSLPEAAYRRLFRMPEHVVVGFQGGHTVVMGVRVAGDNRSFFAVASVIFG